MKWFGRIALALVAVIALLLAVGMLLLSRSAASLPLFILSGALIGLGLSALLGAPMVVVYRVSATTAFIARRMVIFASEDISNANATALLLAHTKGGALQMWFTVSAIFSGGLAGLFLLAFLSRRANRRGVYVGILASVLVTMWAVLTKSGKLVDLGRFNFDV